MSTPQETAYDRIPYQSRSFPHTHPNHLAALARIFGMNPTRVDICRVLELGCASGGNLIPLAVQFPKASYIGIDLSARQVAAGQATIAELGLANIELRHASITDVDDALGKFDYIIVHGVYSWVPAAVQEKLLSVCSRNLASNGIAFVSYNTYPGWRMRSMIRDAMMYHASQFSNPDQQVKQARALIDFFAQNVPVENNPYGILLRQELDDMRKRDDSYLAHEHLEGVNDPLYFHQFMARAADSGLQYLAEAEFATMIPTNFGPKVAETLRLIAPDVIRMEQYMDFLRNRPFRQTLLVHQGVTLNRSLGHASVAGLYVDSSARRVTPDADLRSNDIEKFEGSGGTVLNTSAPITKAAMTILGQRFPQGMRIDELTAAARAMLDGLGNGARAPAASATDAQIVGSDMLQCFTVNLVGLRALPFHFADKPSHRPNASALARLEVKHGALVTNLRNEPLTLDEFNRQLVLRLDGERDRAALVTELAALVETRVLSIQQDGTAITDPAQVRPLIERAVDQNLEQLARVAMLEA